MAIYRIFHRSYFLFAIFPLGKSEKENHKNSFFLSNQNLFFQLNKRESWKFIVKSFCLFFRQELLFLFGDCKGFPSFFKMLSSILFCVSRGRCFFLIQKKSDFLWKRINFQLWGESLFCEILCFFKKTCSQIFPKEKSVRRRRTLSSLTLLQKGYFRSGKTYIGIWKNSFTK